MRKILSWSLDWSGTAQRHVFWFGFAAYLCANLGLGYAVQNLWIEKWVGAGLQALLLFPFASLLVRRLHDAGRVGYWAICAVVPVVNIPFFLYCGFAGTRPAEESKWSRHATHMLAKLFLLVLFTFGMSRYFWEPYWIPSGNMKPTLLVGDYIVANRARRYHEPEYGDVIVFKHPLTERDFIKRIVGLPGDRIQVLEGELHINGQAIFLENVGDFKEAMEPQGAFGSLPRCENSPVRDGEDCLKSRWMETLPNGRAHSVLNIGDQSGDHTPVFNVPEGYFFALGDNRDNSMDSRYPQAAGGMGFIPIGNVVGRASLVVFSSAGRSLVEFWTWRGDRFFKGIE